MTCEITDPRLGKLTLADLAEGLSAVAESHSAARVLLDGLSLLIVHTTPILDELLDRINRRTSNRGNDDGTDAPFAAIAVIAEPGNSKKGGLGATECTLLRMAVEHSEISLVDYALTTRQVPSPYSCTRNRRPAICKLRSRLKPLGVTIAKPRDDTYGPLVCSDRRPTDLALAVAETTEAAKAWRNEQVTVEEAMTRVDKALKLDPGCHQAKTLRLEVALARGAPVETIVHAVREVRPRRELVFSHVTRLRLLQRRDDWRAHRGIIRERLLFYVTEADHLVSLGLLAELTLLGRLERTAEETAFKELCEIITGYRRDPDIDDAKIREKVLGHHVTATIAAAVTAKVRRCLTNLGVYLSGESIFPFAQNSVAEYIVTRLPIEKIQDLNHLCGHTVTSSWRAAYAATLADHLSESEETVRLLLKKRRFTQKIRQKEGRPPTRQEFREEDPELGDQLPHLERIEAKLGGADKSITEEYSDDPYCISASCLPLSDAQAPAISPAMIAGLKKLIREAGVDEQELLEEWIHRNGGLSCNGELPDADRVSEVLELDDLGLAERVASLIGKVFAIAGT